MDNIPLLTRSRILRPKKSRNGSIIVACLERLVRSLEHGEYALVPVNSYKTSALSYATTKSNNSASSSSYAMSSSTSYDSTSTLSTINNFPTEKSYELLVTPKTSVTLTSSEFTDYEYPPSKDTPISTTSTNLPETEESLKSVDRRTCRYVGNRPCSNMDTSVHWEETESDNSDATSTNGTRSSSYTMISANNSLTSAITYSSEASISVSGGRKVHFLENPIVYTISPRKTISSDSNPVSSSAWIPYDLLPTCASSPNSENSPLLTEKSSLVSVTNSEFLSGQLRDLRGEVNKLKTGEKESVGELFRALNAQADLLEEHGGKIEDAEFNAMMLEKRVELAETQIVRLNESIDMMEQQLKKRCCCDNE